MNETEFYNLLQNRGILRFFKFGTPPAVLWVSFRTRFKPSLRRPNMYTNTANHIAAAAFSAILSAAFLAYAIIPASPTLMA